MTWPFFPLFTLMVIAHGFLNGLGCTAASLMCTIVSCVVARMPAATVLSRHLGLDGVIQTVDIGFAAWGVILLTRCPSVGVDEESGRIGDGVVASNGVQCKEQPDIDVKDRECRMDFGAIDFKWILNQWVCVAREMDGFAAYPFRKSGDCMEAIRIHCA